MKANLCTLITSLAFGLISTSAFAQTENPAVVAIDPGHGGKANAGSDAEKNKSTDNNATSATLKIKEKDVALELSKLIAARINGSEAARTGKVRAILTRDQDLNLDFTKRVSKAAEASADIYVAIHFNGDDSKSISGPRAITQQRSKNSNYEADENLGIGLARALERASKKFRPSTPKAMIHDDRELHDGWGSYLFHQLNLNPKTKAIPACHLEVEYLDNRELEREFFVDRKTDVFNAWADAIANELVEQLQRKP